MSTTTLAASVVPLALAALLAVTGAGKLLGRALRAQAARTALPRLVRGPERAVLVLRATGAAELLLAAALVAAPGSPLPGIGTALLGAGFLAYLGVSRWIAPEASCGCTARQEAPIGPASFARAAAVAGGGVLAATATVPWWTAVGARPGAAAAVLAATAALLAYLSAAPGRGWRPPLSRLRLRLFGNPLTTGGTAVPVAATVELLERSLAWETAAPLIRSGLVEHWEADGWRILHYTGARHDAGCACDRPVSVLFALDADADLDRPRGGAVRVSVVDQETDEVLTADLLPG
ncbi:MauE/DoxX family redox-associated membrane protein [Streptomyces avicenniae]|uniref:MauE/DoxX family redox-associated membrane protein n=1 Tax=Streptomyces avicenniae TaxID=500153 RepID=UPI0006998787|nr:MauE/DoxX family redox-associated membrane protein [Streptomyces avicenniae]